MKFGLTVGTHRITERAQEGADRFAELIEAYKTMRGVSGDLLQLSDRDLYTGLLTDGFEWAEVLGINPMLAITEAYRVSLEESVE